MSARWLTIIVLGILFGAVDGRAQPTDPDGATRAGLLRWFEFEEAPPFSCLYTYFPPLLIQNGVELKSFVRSATFRRIKTLFGDTRAIDAIFFYAMRLTNNNTAVSLFLCTTATLNHSIVGVKAPVFSLFFPLTSESEEEFNRRVRNLPGIIYADSPRQGEGDSDKLQHFFGSAFLTFISESASAAERFGEFIEQGEEAFILEGRLDDRDYRANRHGQQFGLALLEDHRRVPSQFLISRFASGEPLCMEGW